MFTLAGDTWQSMAAVFPVMVDAYLVAYPVMMLVGLGGGDRAEGDYGCSKGKNDFFHYRILKSLKWCRVTAQDVPQRYGRMPYIACAANERCAECMGQLKTRRFMAFYPAGSGAR